MAFITLERKKLRDNYEQLDALFNEKDIDWAVVSKILCGHKEYLTEVINLGVKQICDSRASNLKMIKEINPEIETIYIKPPPKRTLKTVVKYADISINTEFRTIKLLSEEAGRQGKVHKVIIMIELGELREGVMRDDLIEFYKRVFKLPNIQIVGLGANLTCLTGVLPNDDKLIQLSLYEQLIEAKFDREIPYVSGGSSVTIPLIFENSLPKGINHFRIGETLFMGTDVYHDSTYENMHNDVFKLYAEIIELIEKPMIPTGEMGTNVTGHNFDFKEEDRGETSYRAIIDLGLLDVDEKHIFLVDESIEFVGASSDMIVVDLGANTKKRKVGDLLEFRMNYMGALRVLNSKYIDKKII
jgi:ornithine racemase